MADTINDIINKTNITSDFIKLGVSKSVCDVVIQLVFYGMDCSNIVINRSARYISCDINNNAIGGGTEFTLKFKMPIPDNREVSYYFHFSDDYVVDVVKSTYIWCELRFDITDKDNYKDVLYELYQICKNYEFKFNYFYYTDMTLIDRVSNYTKYSLNWFYKFLTKNKITLY